MKALRSSLLLFLATVSGLAAQDATPAPATAPTPAPAAAPAPAPAAGATVAPTATAPTPAPTATAPAATDAVPANPLAAPTAAAPAAPALSINMPNSSDTSPAGGLTSSSMPAGTMEFANFPNEEIRTILLNVASIFDFNVSIPETLTGTTSIKLHNVTWQQVYQVVLDPIGYTFVITGSGPGAIVMIKNKADVAAEPMQTLVVKVNSAKAEDLAKSLTNFLDTKSSPPETILPDARTNYLIVTAHPAKMSVIQNAIDSLDKQTQEVSIEAKFVEVNDTDDRNLGIDWNFNGTNLGSLGYAYQYSLLDGLGALTTSGVMPSQVPIQAPSTANLNVADPSSNIGTTIITPYRKAIGAAVFNQAQYTAVLTAMQTINNAKLVSNPSAVTMDNQEITLYSGTNITVVFPTINNQTGTAQAGNNTTYQVGISMKVKPHVTNDGNINLLLNPALSRIDPISDTYFGASYPRIDTRSLTDANVRIQDGFTLAIGGLIDDQDSKATTQVPLLGDLPLIGRLFQSTETIRTRNNLLIFVTAKTLKPAGVSYQDTVTPEAMLRTGLTAPELPGYYNPAADAPGMTYVTPATANTMDALQKARDQAAALQLMQEYQKQMGGKQSPSSQSSSSTSTPPAFQVKK